MATGVEFITLWGRLWRAFPLVNNNSEGIEACFRTRTAVCISPVKTVNFNAVKRQEARNRITAVRKARGSAQTAAQLQRRASLVGKGAKWRITNFKQVARAMSKWA